MYNINILLLVFMDNKRYTKFESCKGFPKTIIINFKEDKKVTISYEEKTLYCKINFELSGKIINDSSPYYLLQITNYDKNTLPDSVYLDLYVFEKPMITDDFMGLTKLNQCTNVLFNKYFECALYVNRNIVSKIDAKFYNKIILLDGIKAVSDSASEKGGWSYEFERKASLSKLK